MMIGIKLMNNKEGTVIIWKWRKLQILNSCHHLVAPVQLFKSLDRFSSAFSEWWSYMWEFEMV